MTIGDNVLLFTAARPSIGTISLNCTMREVHGGSYTIASAPVEESDRISTDHVLKNPVMLEIEGVISQYADNIVDQLRGISGRSDYAQVDYMRSAWARIEALADSRVPFEVVTDRKVYSNMLFVSYQHEDTPEGDAIKLRAMLQQIQVALIYRESTASPAVADALSSTTALGQQPVTLL